MAIFEAFFDESGKFKDKRVVSFCGFVAPLQRRRDFENEWNGILKRIGLKSLSMKRALRWKIPLGSIVPAKTLEERKQALLPFVECIRKHFEMGVATTVDVAAYAKWSPDAKRKVGGSDDPHYFAFLHSLMAISKYIKPDDRVSLICDDDKGTALNCYRLYSRARFLLPDLKQKLVAITFADDDAFVPLQAADLLASLCRLEALSGHPNPAIEGHLKTGHE